MRHRTGVIIGAAALMLPYATGVRADEPALEEVVVTAQKRVESMQDVPIAISALQGDTIKNLQINNITGLYNTMPNVQINTFANSPDSAIFSIRGVGVNDADPYVGTTVSVVVDGVVVGVNTAALLSLFDIERVEVLKGPQGTLFGANTTGGVINVVTKQPTGEFEGEAQVLAGNYGRIDLNAAVNFPIAEGFSGKVSLLHTENDGFFTNVVDGGDLGRQNVTALRPYLKFEAENYDATLIGEYVRSRNGSQTNVNISDPSLLLTVPGLTDTGEIRRVRGQNRDQPDQNFRDTYGVTLTQNLATDFGDFVSITNYREYDQDLYSDDDATQFVWLQTRRQIKHQQFSQELRNSMQLTDAVRLLVGGFYFHQEYELDQDGKLDGFLPGLGQPQTQEQTNESISVFSQVYVDLTDQWRFQGGFRFAHEKTEARSTTANTINAGGQSTFDDPLIPGSLVVAEGEESWNDVGFKFGLDYQPVDDVMLYAYFARGFKSGGFTGRIVVAEDIGPYDPEQLDTIEGGMKAEFFDKRLRTNLAVFYNDYTDMQVVQNITFPSGANSATITNAGAATTWGAELELTAVLLEGLEFNLSAAYLNAEYDEYDTRIADAMGNLIDVSFAGNPLVNAPEWSTSESLRYTRPVGPGDLTLFVQHTYTSSKFSNFTALPEEEVDSLNLVHGTLTWTPSNGRWSIGMFARNLLNEDYFGQKAVFAPSFAIANIGPPRE